MHHKIISTLFIFSILIASPACKKNTETPSNNEEEVKEEEDNHIDEICESSDEHEDCKNDYFWDAENITSIKLNGTSAEITGDGALAEEGLITISSAGNYEISGSLSDGQIMVETDDEETVRLILNGADITNSNSAPIYIADAEKTIVILEEGTKNYLTDNSTYIYDDPEEDEPNATLFSNDDLSIFGEGSLIIDANYNDAINSKEGLIIKSGNIRITAEDDGIIGKNYLIVKGGNMSINAEDDGLKSTNADDKKLGYIAIKDGMMDIIAGGDAIQAQKQVIISGGNGNIISGGGSSSESKSSAKGIQADSVITLDGGTFSIKAADHAIYSDHKIVLNGGDFEIATSKDGIHSKDFTGFFGGKFKITQSNEGIESAVVIIEDGEIEIVADNDGINVSGIVEDAGEQSKWYDTSLGSQYLSIRGGHLAIDASADGIDVNGNMEMTGGTVLINGPVTNDNGIIDFDGTFEISGGLLVGTGNHVLSQKPDTTSTQHSVFTVFSFPLRANDLVHIESTDGDNILTFEPSKEYQCLVFSSPELIANEAYSIFIGGSTTGDEKNGLYENGTYTAGTHYKDFTTSGMVTTVD